jgi:hypothetical protein
MYYCTTYSTSIGNQLVNFSKKKSLAGKKLENYDIIISWVWYFWWRDLGFNMLTKLQCLFYRSPVLWKYIVVNLNLVGYAYVPQYTSQWRQICWLVTLDLGLHLIEIPCFCQNNTQNWLVCYLIFSLECVETAKPLLSVYLGVSSYILKMGFGKLKPKVTV